MRDARTLIAAFLLLPLLPAGALAAEPSSGTDPTIETVHALAAAGHVDQALTQMDRVLKDHPGSAKAHYVEAQLYAREDHDAQGRRELARAEQLAPGLPFADVYSVAELNRQLSLGAASAEGRSAVAAPVNEAGPHIPWSMIAVFGVVAFGLFLMFRRGSAPAPVSQSPWAGSGYGAPVAAPGGLGSGLLGSLAGGAAMGAGFAAGEEVIEHMFGGGERREEARPSDSFDGGNRDMGGNDFGITDDGSWDDGTPDNGGW